MSKIKFTENEKMLMSQYLAMPKGVGPRIHSWIAEILPAILLLAYGLSTSKPIFIIAGFLPLFFFSSKRMYMQFKCAHLLQSICEKIDEHQKNETIAQPGNREVRETPAENLTE